MKIAYIQPPYPQEDPLQKRNTLDFMLREARNADVDTDLLVFEYVKVHLTEFEKEKLHILPGQETGGCA